MKTFILLVDVSLILLISSQATNQNTRNITIYLCVVYLSLIKFLKKSTGLIFISVDEGALPSALEGTNFAQ